jgi:hypothetical protein
MKTADLRFILAVPAISFMIACRGGDSGSPATPTSARLDSGAPAGSAAVTVVSTGAHRYTTNFPLTENPISEGGRWINGGAVGLDWTNVSTKAGLVRRLTLWGRLVGPVALC